MTWQDDIQKSLKKPFDEFKTEIFNIIENNPLSFTIGDSENSNEITFSSYDKNELGWATSSSTDLTLNFENDNKNFNFFKILANPLQGLHDGLIDKFKSIHTISNSDTMSLIFNTLKTEDDTELLIITEEENDIKNKLQQVINIAKQRTQPAPSFWDTFQNWGRRLGRNRNYDIVLQLLAKINIDDPNPELICDLIDFLSKAELLNTDDDYGYNDINIGCTRLLKP